MTRTLLDWRRRTAAIYAAVRRESDPAVAHALWVDARTELYATHPDSPGRPRLRHAAYDGRWRFAATVLPSEPQRLKVQTGTDGVVPFERIGRVEIGEIGALDVWWLASYGGGLWLPMADTHPDTYGGGRYVLDTVKGADLGAPRDDNDALVVDLNFAYNPSCAYEPHWSCPLAPQGNRLAVPVPVGELLPFV